MSDPRHPSTHDVAGIQPARQPARITHGRHCTCSACKQEDWARPELAPCGMHGPTCPPEYAPLGGAGDPHESFLRCGACGEYVLIVRHNEESLVPPQEPRWSWEE